MLEFIKDKAAVLIIAVLVIIGAVYFGITRSSGPDETPGTTPTAAPTAALGDGAEGPDPSPTESGSPDASKGPETGTQPPGATVPEEDTGAEPEYRVGDTQQAVEASDWSETADAFSAAWANPEGGKEAWLARLKPYLTPSLYKSFSYTDIRNIPTDTFVSNSPGEEGGGTMIFHALYEEGGNRFNGLLEIQHDGTWLVKTIGPGENS